MSCPSRTSGHPYTTNQREHLVGLLNAGAVSRETGVGPGVRNAFPHGLNALVVGALRDRGLAQSRSVRRKMQSWTEYWLTDLGRAEAELISSGEAPVHG